MVFIELKNELKVQILSILTFCKKGYQKKDFTDLHQLHQLFTNYYKVENVQLKLPFEIRIFDLWICKMCNNFWMGRVVYFMFNHEYSRVKHLVALQSKFSKVPSDGQKSKSSKFKFSN